ncbi:MAG: hypothetical protein ACI4E1_10205 [Lachnospira sp.]
MTKEIKIILDTDEIAYDVMNKTHLNGESIEGEKYEPSYRVRIGYDDDEQYQLSRAISNAVMCVKTELSEYLNEEHSVADNFISELVQGGESVEFIFDMPTNYDSSCVDSLSSSIHKFVVCKSIGEWYLLKNSQLAPTYFTLSSEAISNVKKNLFKRVRPKRPKTNH